MDKAGIAFRAVNPRRPREYARCAGILAKTDRIDAAVLRAFGRATRLAPRARPPACVGQLAALEGLREDLASERTRWANRLAAAAARGAAVPASVLASHRSYIRVLDARAERAAAAISEHLRAHGPLRERLEVPTRATGVGERTAAALLAFLPELGTLGPKAAASLCGTAPFARESGTLRGHRVCHGARRQVRRALHMACLSAVAHDPVLREFYQRLLGRGKKKMTAMTAAARKLVIYLDYQLKPIGNLMVENLPE